MAKKLHRSNNEKVLGGVAGGIGEYFDIDPVIVRALFLIALFAGGASILVYIVLWIIIPQRPYFTDYHSNQAYSNEPNSEFNSTSDDYQTDEYQNVENMEKKTESSESLKMFFGISLIVIGALFLLDKFVDEVNFEYIFPGILVALGIYLIAKAGKEK